MKKYFTEYINDMNALMIDARLELSRAQSRVEQAERELRNSSSPMEKEYAAAGLSLAKDEYRKAVQSVNKSVETRAREIRRELEEHAAHYVRMDPRKLDVNTVTILNSGAVTVTDLQVMAGDNWNNPTMLRLIASKARELYGKTGNRLENGSLEILARKIDSFVDPSSRLSVFDTALAICKRAIQNDYSASEKFGHMWDDVYYKKMLDNMGVLDSFSTEVM